MLNLAAVLNLADISDHVTSSAILPILPPCESLTDLSFVWGSTDSSSFFLSITAAFEEVVHWKGIFSLFLEVTVAAHLLRNWLVYSVRVPKLLVLKPLL